MSGSMIRIIKQESDLTDEAFMVALAAALEPGFRTKFLELVEALQTFRTLEEIEELIRLGNIDELLNFPPALFEPFGEQFEQAITIAAQQTSNVVNAAGAITVTITFDQTNFRAVNVIQHSQLRTITEFTQEQITATQRALIDGVERGLNPREQARNFRDSIGLTSKQQLAVANYRKLLENNSKQALNRQLRDRRFDRSVERAIDTGVALSQEKIDRMVDRYRERYIKYRSEVIARTEALRSVHQGSDELYEQAIQSGALNREDLIQTWTTARDERVRGSHAPMNGQRREIGVNFVSGSGHPLAYPGDENAPASETVQCRCVKTTRFIG